MLATITKANSLLVVTIIIGVIIIIIIANYYSDKKIIFRELKRSKKKSIINSKEGEYVKLVGQALDANNPLIAPLTQKKCVFYHTLIQHRNDDSWVKYIEEEKTQDFFIKVNGELAIVKPNNHYSFRKTHIVLDYSKKTKSSLEKTPNLERFLSKHDKTGKTFLFGFKKELLCQEGMIEINEKITIKGIAKWITLKELIEGYPYSKILTISGNQENNLLITDATEALKL